MDIIIKKYIHVNLCVRTPLNQQHNYNMKLHGPIRLKEVSFIPFFTERFLTDDDVKKKNKQTNEKHTKTFPCATDSVQKTCNMQKCLYINYGQNPSYRSLFLVCY